MSQDIKKVPQDIAALKPTLFVGVPRVFDKLCAGQLALPERSFVTQICSDEYWLHIWVYLLGLLLHNLVNEVNIKL